MATKEQRKRYMRTTQDDEATRINHLFDYDDRKVGSATGILSRLWRIMLAELNINNDNYPMLMTKYLDKRLKAGNRNVRALNTLRGNLNRQLAMPNMSFNVFLRALRVLRVDWLKIDITIGRGGKKTMHSIEVTDFEGFMNHYEQTIEDGQEEE